MNIILVVCLLAGIITSVQPTFMKVKLPMKQVCCYDSLGHRIEPGHSYFDGCNTCTCGKYGMPILCTRKLCGSKIFNSIKPVYMKKKKPVYSTTPKIVKPVVKVVQPKPVHHIHVVKSVEKVRPVISVKPVYQVQPVKVVKEVYVVNNVEPMNQVHNINHVSPVEQVKPVYPAHDVNLVYPIEQIKLVDPIHQVNHVYPIEHLKTVHQGYKFKSTDIVQKEDD